MTFFSKCENIFNESKQLFNEKQYDLIFSHFGEFDSKKINEFSSETEEYLISKKEPKKIVKSFFNIIIEGLQNIKNHGETSPKGKQISYCHIASIKDSYSIHFSNLILNKNILSLTQAVNRLNNVDADGVKKIYLETLTNGEISKKGGAGLGIITMAMKSKNKILLNSHPIDDKFSILTLEIKLDKK